MRLALLACAALLVAGCAGEEDRAEDLIAFASSRGGDFELYVMRPDGSDVRQLTDNATADEGAPVWSPDGRWIAYMSNADNSSDDAVAEEVFVMAADGSKAERLTDNALADLVSGWTADGEIVFWRCREGVARCDLRMIKRDGSGESRIYETEDAVFSSTGPYRGEIYASILERDAKSFDDIEKLSIDVETGAARPAREGIPSPDGDERLIETDRDENGPCLFHDCTGHAPEIYVDDRRLTHTTGEDSHARWSPGGDRIVFARIANDDGDDYELWVMNEDGSCQTQLTENRAWDWTPDWHGSPETDHPLDC